MKKTFLLGLLALSSSAAMAQNAHRSMHIVPDPLLNKTNFI